MKHVAHFVLDGIVLVNLILKAGKDVVVIRLDGSQAVLDPASGFFYRRHLAFLRGKIRCDRSRHADDLV